MEQLKKATKVFMKKCKLLDAATSVSSSTLTSKGSAWLVIHQLEGKKYIAKKVILDGLSAREQESCMLEVNLLKNLNHPNIVTYKESFLLPSMIVIIMEFCEGNFFRFLTV